MSVIAAQEPRTAGPAARRSSVAVQIGKIRVGGGAPIVVQSMTNTDTEDAPSTAKQIAELARAGSELVRITVNTPAAAAAVPRIVERLDMMGVSVPIIGDFHYNGHQLLKHEPACAELLAKYRINPGNVGFGAKHESQFAQIIEIALRNDKPVRIGVNWGSLDQGMLTALMDENAQRANPWDAGAVAREALIRSALDSAAQAEALGMGRGMGSKGITASSAALAVLLQEGIGDTIRISLTPEPGASRTGEVIVAQELLQTMGLRAFSPLVTACPGCGRTTSEFFTLAVMGCIVNGPGESKHANIGISLPGNGEAPAAPVFIDGEKAVTLRGEHIAEEFVGILDDYVARKYAMRAG